MSVYGIRFWANVKLHLVVLELRQNTSAVFAQAYTNWVKGNHTCTRWRILPNSPDSLIRCWFLNQWCDSPNISFGGRKIHGLGSVFSFLGGNQFTVSLSLLIAVESGFKMLKKIQLVREKKSGTFVLSLYSQRNKDPTMCMMWTKMR